MGDRAVSYSRLGILEAEIQVVGFILGELLKKDLLEGEPRRKGVGKELRNRSNLGLNQELGMGTMEYELH